MKIACCYLQIISFEKNSKRKARIIAFPAYLEFRLLVGLDCFPQDGDLLGDVAGADFAAFVGLLEILADLGAMFSGEEEEGGKWTFGLGRLN